MDTEDIIRCMLLPLAQDWLLLPNAAVAEIIAFVEPTQCDSDLLIGFIDWRGVSVPIMSFEEVCGLAIKESSIRDRIAILYNPDGDEKKSYLGIKLIDIPMSFRAEKDKLVDEEILIDRAEFVVSQLNDDNRRLFIPNLDTIFKEVT